MDDLKKALGKHLRKLREEKYKNRAKFARSLGLDDQDIYDYEVGKKYPRIEILIGLYKKLDKSFEELLNPILNLPEINVKISNLIKRIKNISKNEKNIERLNGFISALEQEIEIDKKRKRLPSSREAGRENSTGAESSDSIEAEGSDKL